MKQSLLYKKRHECLSFFLNTSHLNIQDISMCIGKVKLIIKYPHNLCILSLQRGTDKVVFRLLFD